ncbi:MAG: riboflavin synthase [Deltaproteobacteria bacterium]|nr:MAG: riboflavin synthase [Deltaproteobacteria bacterium]
MFTGLIEDVGTVAAVEGSRLAVQSRFDDLGQGDSVAVDGVCLTVVDTAVGRFRADVSAETQQRSTLGSLKRGDRVNLERPLALGDRLGGHLVLGHVDGVGEIVARQTIGEGVRVELRIPRQLAPLVVEKGSIALDGISLTVNQLLGDERIALFLIPETLRATTWGDKLPGARVNVEADILGKHVARLMEGRLGG